METEFINDENTPPLDGNNDDSVYAGTQEEINSDSVLKDHDAIIRGEAARIKLCRREKNIEKLGREIKARLQCKNSL